MNNETSNAAFNEEGRMRDGVGGRKEGAERRCLVSQQPRPFSAMENLVEQMIPNVKQMIPHVSSPRSEGALRWLQIDRKGNKKTVSLGR